MTSLEIIGKIAAASEKPFYLAGDLNAVPDSPAGSDQNNYPVIIGGGNGVKNATVMVLKKVKDKLYVKVLNTRGEVLLEWED